MDLGGLHQVVNADNGGVEQEWVLHEARPRASLEGLHVACQICILAHRVSHGPWNPCAHQRGGGSDMQGKAYLVLYEFHFMMQWCPWPAVMPGEGTGMQVRVASHRRACVLVQQCYHFCIA